MQLLSQFHMDNQYVVERVLRLYCFLYENRKKVGKIQGSPNRRKVAMSFSICKVLHREGMPRPVRHVAAVCGLPSQQHGRLLRAGRELKLQNREEQKAGEYTEAKAEDYVQTLCIHLGLPFALGQEAERVLQLDAVRWQLYGRRPHHLAGGVIERLLQYRQCPSKLDAICATLGCSAASIKKITRVLSFDLFRV